MRIPARLNAPLALVVVLSACTEPSSKTATSPSGPDTVSVTIDGPSTIAPGQTAQFTATMRLSDGTTKIALAPNVTWRSSNLGVLTVSTAGVGQARGFTGETVVTADVTRLTPNSVRSASREIIILPDGTYRVVGTITDAEFPTIPVAGARVQIVPGTLQAITDTNGVYKLYGVPPGAQIQVTADGYQPLTDSVPFTTNATRNYQLTLPGPRQNLTGNYRLAIDVNGACSSLNDDLKHRKYDATIAQNGPALTVSLTEPIFRTNGTRGNRFFGTAGATGATFTLDAYSFYYYYYGPASYPSVAERLSNGTYLVPEGRAVTTASSGGSLVGTLAGDVSNWDSRFPSFGFFLGSCFNNIAFSLTPR
jgi:hypothetical protein